MKNTYYDLSEEVHQEREKIRTYAKGLLKYPTTYKGQALRELSMRLELEEKIKGLQQRLDAADNLLDGVSAGDLEVNGMGIEWNEKYIKSFKKVGVSLK